MAFLWDFCLPKSIMTFSRWRFRWYSIPSKINWHFFVGEITFSNENDVHKHICMFRIWLWDSGTCVSFFTLEPGDVEGDKIAKFSGTGDVWYKKTLWSPDRNIRPSSVPQQSYTLLQTFKTDIYTRLSVYTRNTNRLAIFKSSWCAHTSIPKISVAFQMERHEHWSITMECPTNGNAVMVGGETIEMMTEMTPKILWRSLNFCFCVANIFSYA